MTTTISTNPAIQDSYRKAVTNVKQLLNSDLKRVLRQEGLLVSGVKIALQQRIIDRLCQYANAGNTDRLAQLSASIAPNQSHGPSPYPALSSHTNQSHPGSMEEVMSKPVSFQSDVSREIVAPLTPTVLLDRLPTIRHTALLEFRLTPEVIEQLKKGTHHVMLYCTYELKDPNPRIGFPTTLQLDINDTIYEGNLKPIKKKTGGPVNPADITDLIRKHPNYTNAVKVGYGSTGIDFAMAVYLVKKYSVAEFLSKMRSGNTVSKARTLTEFRKKEQDADIQATSLDLPLKDPATGMRITLPLKTISCSHLRCFDAEGFFLLQEQAPHLSCHICNAPVRCPGDLAVDDFMSEILRSVGDNADQVTVNIDGSWKMKGQDQNQHPSSSNQNQSGGRKKQRVSYNLDDDDDNGDLAGLSPNADVTHATNTDSTPQVKARTRITPASTSREQSHATPISGAASNKRKAQDVVDLTLSDDEDQNPPRPQIKRASTSGLNSGTNNPHGIYGPAGFQAAQSAPLPGQYIARDTIDDVPFSWSYRSDEQQT